MKKTHHASDYAKDRTADVIKHGSGQVISSKHWEINGDITPHGDNSAWGAFLPRTSKSRPQPYEKLNECDH